jgi:O-methyltransferase involved in polyketide biosynthesis
MDNKTKVLLGDIQKTLFMPVWARAVETQKKKPLLTDKTAVEIVNSVDFDFEKMSRNVSEISQIAWIARCMRFDAVINEFIKLHPNATIVNIGCGLDTTYERIGNSAITWFDLDLPDVIAMRRKFLNESDKRKFISSSFLETKWLDCVPKENLLFISTGVFVYFEESVIKNFFLEIANTVPGSEWFFDVTSPKGVEIANQVIAKSGLSSNSFFKWGLTDTSKISSWDTRIELINIYYTFKMKGLGLGFRNWLKGYISDSLNIQYMVHLKIGKS